MKTRILLLLPIMMAGVYSCRDTGSRYLDLNTNQYVDLKKDSTTGLMVDAHTGKPVDVYVDTRTNDTVYGQTGKVVNGKLYQTEEGRWIVKAGGDEYKVKSESEHSAKVKREGEEYKFKDGNYTVKREGDGDVKIENGSTQVKIDGKTGERKVKKDKNITDKVKKIFH